MVPTDDRGDMFQRWPNAHQFHFRYPSHWERWTDLTNIAPGLEMIGKTSPNQRRPPAPLHDSTFLSLAACFADPRRREILRALILDLLAEDLAAILCQPKPKGKR